MEKNRIGLKFYKKSYGRTAKMVRMWSFFMELFENKRPRGIDALLGHLLEKRILVWCELTTGVAVQTSLKM